MDPRIPPDPPIGGGVIHRGVCEFGELLAELLEAVPEACGAVLSDGVDDTIDTAHRPAMISELDICIAGAQVGQPMTRVNITAIIFGLGRPQVVLESPERVLISKVLWQEYLLTLILLRRADITTDSTTDSTTDMARTMRAFEDTAERVLALLRS
ncbi:MAG: hypothetical protein R6X02_31040 [Enhygromyxa sp.]